MPRNLFSMDIFQKIFSKKMEGEMLVYADEALASHVNAQEADANDRGEFMGS